jgi:hypothetical protein
MKAYLITTCLIFSLIGVLHLLRDITERSRLATDPWPYLAEAALGLVAAALAVWAWRLIRAQGRP